MRSYELFLIAVFAAIVAFQCFVPPTIGLANNGDFSRLISWFSLGPESGNTDDEYNYFSPRWVYSPAYHRDDVKLSSELLLIVPALRIGRLFSRRVFDLHILGVLHALLLVGAFAALLPLFRSFVAPLVPLAIFTDVCYVAYCNTFYMDAAALVFLAWTAVLALHLALSEQVRLGLFALFIVAAVLLISSKPQHALGGVFLFAFAVRTALLLEGRRRRAAGISLACVLLVTTGVMLATSPAGEKEETLFETIFYKIVQGSPTPVEDLRELGLPPEYVVHSGMWAYHPNSPMNQLEFRREFAERTSYGKLGRFYVRHPARALAIVYADLRVAASYPRPGYLGNYQRKDGFAPKTRAEAFGWWSAFRHVCYERLPWHILVWYAALLGFALWRRNRVAELAVMFAGMALTELGVTTLADAAETDRHLFLFHALNDVSFCFAAVGLLVSRGRL